MTLILATSVASVNADISVDRVNDAWAEYHNDEFYQDSQDRDSGYSAPLTSYTPSYSSSENPFDSFGPETGVRSLYPQDLYNDRRNFKFYIR